MWIKGEPAVEGDTENHDLVGNLDQGHGNVDNGGIRKCLCAFCGCLGLLLRICQG